MDTTDHILLKSVSEPLFLQIIMYIMAIPPVHAAMLGVLTFLHHCCTSLVRSWYLKKFCRVLN